MTYQCDGRTDRRTDGRTKHMLSRTKNEKNYFLASNLTSKVKCHFGNWVILKAWTIVILSGMVASFEQKMPSSFFKHSWVGWPTIVLYCCIHLYQAKSLEVLSVEPKGGRARCPYDPDSNYTIIYVGKHTHWFPCLQYTMLF